MVAIPVSNKIQELVDKQLVEYEHRPYLGMSGLGHKCQRKLWYDFRWAYTNYLTPRIARIFERGDIEEARVIRDLERIGVVITSDQFEVTDESGHSKGHIDGLACNVPGAEKTKHLLEIKTMNERRFNEYAKNEDLRATNFPYYVQINQYMGRLNLSRCIFVVKNKNNEERIYSRIQFDPDNYKEYKAIGFDILTSELPPPRIGSKVWYDCKMCSAKETCHEGKPIRKTCRTCVNVNIEQNGEWSCSAHNGRLSIDMQREGCELYELIEGVQ